VAAPDVAVSTRKLRSPSSHRVPPTPALPPWTSPDPLNQPHSLLPAVAHTHTHIPCRQCPSSSPRLTHAGLRRAAPALTGLEGGPGGRRRVEAAAELRRILRAVREAAAALTSRGATYTGRARCRRAELARPPTSPTTPPPRTAPAAVSGDDAGPARPPRTPRTRAQAAGRLLPFYFCLSWGS